MRMAVSRLVESGVLAATGAVAAGTPTAGLAAADGDAAAAGRTDGAAATEDGDAAAEAAAAGAAWLAGEGAGLAAMEVGAGVAGCAVFDSQPTPNVNTNASAVTVKLVKFWCCRFPTMSASMQYAHQLMRRAPRAC